MAVVGVTGGAGFIGGRLVPFLAQKGHVPKLVDDLTGPIQVHDSRWPVARADFSSKEGLEALSGCEVILHLAAISGVVACASNPEASRRVNLEGTQRLVDWARASGIPVAFASSMAVVGVPERLPITEETPAHPTHEYARQKAEGERIVRQLGRPGWPGAAVLRMTNVYGTYESGGRTVAKGNVLNLFAGQAAGGVLRVNAPGTQRRDFVHIEDVVAHWEAAVRFLLSHRGEGIAPTFNVASGEDSTILELADRVQRRWSALFPNRPPLKIEVVPNPRGSIELLQPEFSVRREATQRELGVRCRYTIDGVLEELLRRPPSVGAPPPAR